MKADNPLIRLCNEYARTDLELGFDDRCNEILTNPLFDYAEVGVREFVSWIFERGVKYLHGEVEPFEELGSPEYKLWLAQKKAGVKVIDYDGYACWRYNPVVFYISYDKTGPDKSRNRHRALYKDDESTMHWLEEDREFALMAPVTFAGRNNTAKNARYLYAFAIDLDGVRINELRTLFWQCSKGVLPLPNIISNSGHGLHLYYLLENPVPMYTENIRLLNCIKRGLTNLLWQPGYTTTLDTTQYQGVLQGFRVPGTMTKFDRKVRSFVCSDIPRYTLAQLNDRLGAPEGKRGVRDRFHNKLTPQELLQLGAARPKYNPTGVTRKEAQRRWPEWYNRVVEQGVRFSSKKWHVSRALYDWWLRRIKSGVEDGTVMRGHRYWHVFTLVAFAIKCDVPKDEVRRDAFSLIPMLDALSNDPKNRFTTKDVRSALKLYRASAVGRYINWPRHMIEEKCNTHLPAAKRNPKPIPRSIQVEHARTTKIWKRNGGFGSDYKSTHRDLVAQWQANNPGGTKPQCAEALKISMPTVRRWWTEEPIRARIETWRGWHPQGNKSQCARDLGLSRPTVIKYWDDDKEIVI